MDGTFVRDFEQALALLGGQGAGKTDVTVDLVQHAIPRFAFLAVFCINTRVSKRNRDILERNLFPVRV